VSGYTDILEIVRLAMSSPEARRELTERISSRREDLQTIERLVTFARQRQTTSAHALVRRVLTDAGVSWEAR
jgi:hypothetical protein